MRHTLAALSLLAACPSPGAGGTETDVTTSTTTSNSSMTSGGASTTTEPTTSTGTGEATTSASVCPANLCGDLLAWCLAHDITDGICVTLAESICPGDPCESCRLAPGHCMFGDDACKAEAAAVCEGSRWCDCVYDCDAPLPPEKQTSLCFVHPWTVGGWCDEPDEDVCLAVMASACAPTACEYLDCVVALDDEPCAVPAACEAIQACHGGDR